jgi:hypothetical protein
LTIRNYGFIIEAERAAREKQRRRPEGYITLDGLLKLYHIERNRTSIKWCGSLSTGDILGGTGREERAGMKTREELRRRRMRRRYGGAAFVGMILLCCILPVWAEKMLG